MQRIVSYPGFFFTVCRWPAGLAHETFGKKNILICFLRGWNLIVHIMRLTAFDRCPWFHYLDARVSVRLSLRSLAGGMISTTRKWPKKQVQHSATNFTFDQWIAQSTGLWWSVGISIWISICPPTPPPPPPPQPPFPLKYPRCVPYLINKQLSVAEFKHWPCTCKERYLITVLIWLLVLPSNEGCAWEQKH